MHFVIIGEEMGVSVEEMVAVVVSVDVAVVIVEGVEVTETSEGR